MSSRGATLGVSIALAVGLGVGGSQLPVPYVALGPGPVYDTLGTTGGTQLIQLPPDKDHPAKGELNLTTVNVYPDLNLREAVAKWFDRSFAVVPRDVVYPRDQSEEESNEATRREMRESQDHAITAALCELGTPVMADVVIDDVADGSAAAKAGLRENYVITAIDGQAVDSVCTLRKLMRKHRPGDVVRVGFRRGGADETATVRTQPDQAGPDGAPRMGVGIVERDQKPPFEIKIALDDVGGPSAGLMFALGIYDRLTPGDLTGGKVIAGTGSIDDDGTVGAIGGIQQKLVAAKDHGAVYFLVPDGNWDAAVATKPDGLRLARIKTLRDALDALAAIREGREP